LKIFVYANVLSLNIDPQSIEKRTHIFIKDLTEKILALEKMRSHLSIELEAQCVIWQNLKFNH
jgi:hypothetical protein